MVGGYEARNGIYKSAATAILVAIFLLVPSGCSLQTRANVNPTIAPEALLKLIEGGKAPLVIDVRSEDEFRDGHIPGSVNIPYTRDFNRIGFITDHPDQTVIIYCRSGRRTRIVRGKMVAAGLRNKNIFTLRGHFPEGLKMSYPLAEEK
jgi:rhodanese-related sulfurtransferase